MANNKLFNNPTFTFIGKATYPKKDSAPISIGAIKEGSVWSRKRLQVGVMDENQNTGYLSMEYLFKPSDPKVRLFTKDKPIDVDIKDLANEKYIDLMPSYSQIVIDLETDEELKKEYLKDVYALRNYENKEELTDEDKEKIAEHKKNIKEKAKNRFTPIHMDTAIDILGRHLPELEDKKVKVTGRVRLNYYNNTTRLEYIPNTIQLAKEDEKSELTINANVFFNEDSLDNDEEAKKIYINSYFGQVDKKKNKVYPYQLILNYEKLDPKNTLHAQMLEFLTKSFEVEDSDFMYCNKYQIQVINSRKKVEFSEETLTEQQKTMIALGLAKLDDFRPRGNIYGDRESYLQIIKPTLTDDFANGSLQAFDMESFGTFLVGMNDDTAPIKEDEVKEDKPKEENSPMDFSSLFGM